MRVQDLIDALRDCPLDQDAEIVVKIDNEIYTFDHLAAVSPWCVHIRPALRAASGPPLNSVR
jgi:hypothetical protein